MAPLKGRDWEPWRDQVSGRLVRYWESEGRVFMANDRWGFFRVPIPEDSYPPPEGPLQ